MAGESGSRAPGRRRAGTGTSTAAAWGSRVDRPRDGRRELGMDVLPDVAITGARRTSTPTIGVDAQPGGRDRTRRPTRPPWTFVDHARAYFPSPTLSIAPSSFLMTASAIVESLSPPLALTTPARMTATRRIRPTYSTVPCPRASRAARDSA